jgi:hypothetical protein
MKYLIFFFFVTFGPQQLWADIYDVHCELSPEVSFKIINLSSSSSFELIEAGYSYQGIEVGNPAHCELKNNREFFFNLNCEEANTLESFTLNFFLNFLTTPFEILKRSNQESLEEIIAPCFMVNKR